MAPPAELRKKLGLAQEQILKFEGSVYGLRTAPRSWYKRVRADLESLGWRVHQLDQCIFCLCDNAELFGLNGVYVDEFIIAGSKTDKRWKRATGCD